VPVVLLSLHSVVQGVRRWISTSHTNSAPKKPPKKVISSPIDTKRNAIPVEVDRHSTEAVAKQLLDPTVSEAEEAEYQGFVQIHDDDINVLIRFSRYIDQCQELLDAPTTMGERKDLEVYSMAIRTAIGDTPDWPEEIPKEFSTYVERGLTEYWDGGSGRGERLHVNFSYERWLGITDPR
jgi:hypothetical protein